MKTTIYSNLTFTALLLAIAVSLVQSIAQPTIAKTVILQSKLQNNLAVKFNYPSAKRPYKGNRSPGAGKGICPQVTLPLTVLMPTIPNKNKGLDTWSQTAIDRPLIWVYVPYASTLGHRFDLRLKIVSDDSDAVAVERTVALPKEPRIMPISLPTDVRLEIGKNYTVELRTTCDTVNKAQFWLQRVNSTLDSPLLGRDRVQYYADNGLWLDTLTEVMALNSTRTLMPEWGSFIESSLGWDLQEVTVAGEQDKKNIEQILKEPIN